MVLSSYFTSVCLQDSLFPRQDLKISICHTHKYYTNLLVFLDIVWQFVNIKNVSHFDLFLVLRGLTSPIYLSCAVL